MDSKEYLRALARAVHRKKPPEIEEIIRKNLSDTLEEGVQRGEICGTLQDAIFTSSMEAFDSDKYMFPKDLEKKRGKAIELLDGNFPELQNVEVGLIDVPNFTGFSFMSDAGEASVGLSASLWMPLRVILQCLKAISTRNTPQAYGSHHSDETYVENISCLLPYLRGEVEILVYSTDWEHSIQDLIGATSKPDVLVLEGLERVQLFVLLHELGHLALKHKPAEDVVGQVAATYESGPINGSKMQEYLADEFACKYIWDHSELGFSENWITVDAISKFFLVADFVQGEVVQTESDIHPSPIERLENILSYLNSINTVGDFNELYKVALHNAQLCHIVKEKIRALQDSDKRLESCPT